VQGVGYEVFLAKASEGRVAEGQLATLLISESVTAFDGATTLYGFLTKEEKDFYNRLRENVDGMGPKKAMETLDKISKSLPDFKRAIIDEDSRLLISVFGFTKKTAEKLILSLKGKVESWTVSGTTKWQESPRSPKDIDVLSALINLGYEEPDARDVLQKAKAQLPGEVNAETLLKEALRLIGSRLS
jgi:Holliday junction DNA helicase RuvA